MFFSGKSMEGVKVLIRLIRSLLLQRQIPVLLVGKEGEEGGIVVGRALAASHLACEEGGVVAVEGETHEVGETKPLSRGL